MTAGASSFLSHVATLAPVIVAIITPVAGAFIGL
jgi:hypothetical protein